MGSGFNSSNSAKMFYRFSLLRNTGNDKNDIALLIVLIEAPNQSQRVLAKIFRLQTIGPI
jgi:hypothetical protein